MKIAICTPFHGDVTAEYAYSLTKLVLRTGQTQINFNGEVVSPTIELFMRTSSVLPQLRNMLVKDAIGWGANYLLWVDGDHKFPEDALLRLLSLNLPVVGTNYPRRVPPHRPTGSTIDHQPIETTEEAARAGELVAAASMGLGFCLIDMTVFDRVHELAVAKGDDGMWPLFAIEMFGDGTEIVGEDVFFFRKLREAGVALYVDQAVSWGIAHIYQRALTNGDVAPGPLAPPPAPTAAAITPNVRISFTDRA